MDIISLEHNMVTLRISGSECGMLRFATGGSVFSSTKNRNIPALPNWTKSEALSFEKTIKEQFHVADEAELIIALTVNKLLYLARIHEDTMQELDPIEYPTITGYKYEQAKQLLRQIKEIVDMVASV